MSDLKPTPRESRYHIQTVADAMDILTLLSDSKEPLAIGEIARRQGLTMNTAFRMCETLKDGGLIQEVGGKYSLGMKLMLLWAKTKAKLESQRDQINRFLAAARDDQEQGEE